MKKQKWLNDCAEIDTLLDFLIIHVIILAAALP